MVLITFCGFSQQLPDTLIDLRTVDIIDSNEEGRTYRIDHIDNVSI